MHQMFVSNYAFVLVLFYNAFSEEYRFRTGDVYSDNRIIIDYKSVISYLQSVLIEVIY